MNELIQVGYGKFGNKLEFYKNPNGSITVSDRSCLLERIYFIGGYGYLGKWKNDNIVREVIKSADQIIEAWISGKVWF